MSFGITSSLRIAPLLLPTSALRLAGLLQHKLNHGAHVHTQRERRRAIFCPIGDWVVRVSDSAATEAMKLLGYQFNDCVNLFFCHFPFSSLRSAIAFRIGATR